MRLRIEFAVLLAFVLIGLALAAVSFAQWVSS